MPKRKRFFPLRPSLRWFEPLCSYFLVAFKSLKMFIFRNGSIDRSSKQVTILGESAGSCSVFLQTVSVNTFNKVEQLWKWPMIFQPLNSGLIHRAIAQSGGNLGPGFLCKCAHPQLLFYCGLSSHTLLQVLGTTQRVKSAPLNLGQTWLHCLAAKWDSLLSDDIALRELHSYTL